MTTITPDSIRGDFCSQLREWFEGEFGESAEEAEMVQRAAEQGHINAVAEYLLSVIMQEDILARTIRTLASIPAQEGVAWKDIVEEAKKGDPDVPKIRSVLNGWPDDRRLAKGVVRLARGVIQQEPEGDRPGLWVQLIAAARGA